MLPVRLQAVHTDASLCLCVPATPAQELTRVRQLLGAVSRHLHQRLTVRASNDWMKQGCLRHAGDPYGPL
jgi:hypothetical protein